MSENGLSTMLMKTINIETAFHYVDEKEGSCAPGYTGRRQRMKDPHEEGVANHSAPGFALYVARHAAKRKQGNRWAGY